MPDTDAAVYLTTAELAEHLRITFRQLDYWVRRAYLPTAYPHPGSGVRRLWSAEEVRAAEAFASLVHAGVGVRAVAEAMPSLLLGRELFAVQLGRLTVTGPLL